MPVKNLEEALHEEMRDILSAEKQITKSLKKMIKKASNEKLKAAFEEHLQQTEGQIERLEEAFGAMGKKPRAKHCDAMGGILSEGDQVMEEAETAEVMDAMMVAAAQKVEHYEIASYGTLCQWAETLGLSQVKKLLGQNLQEEEATDKKLTKLAQTLNRQAQPA